MWRGGLHHLAGSEVVAGRCVGGTSGWSWVEHDLLVLRVLGIFGVCRMVEVDANGGGGRGKMLLGEIL